MQLMQNPTEPPFPQLLRGSPSFKVPEDVSTLSPNDDDIDIQVLLAEASRRMKSEGDSSELTTVATGAPSTKFPKLQPGNLPKPYLEIRKGIAVTTQQPNVASNGNVKPGRGAMLRVDDPVKTKKELKQKREKTAGSDWFNLPRTELTPQVKRDIQIIKLRNVLDPHKHFKKDESKEFPKYFQMGTVVEGATEFHSARINRKDRKKSIVDELLSSKESKARFKKKYNDIQSKKRSGKKEFYNKLKSRRKGQSSG